MWSKSSDGLDDVTVEEFLYCFEPTQITTFPGFWTFRNKEVSVRLVDGLQSSNRGWKDEYFFIYGDNWERLPEEGDDYIQIRRTWGTLSSASVCVCAFSNLVFTCVCIFPWINSCLVYAALTRPTLTQVWKDHVLRVHRLSNRQYTYYIQPELLFRHSFSLEPSDAVLTLIRTNEKSKGHRLFIFGNGCCFMFTFFSFFYLQGRPL